MFGIGSTELLIIGGIITLLFGARKVPELAQGIAKGIRSFRKELNSEETTPSKPPETETPTPRSLT